jgi:hypothetical protein
METKERVSEKRTGLFWGLVMVVIGLVILGTQFLNLGAFWGQIGVFILPVLGVIFLAWGIFNRVAGFIIPGSILSGLGTGVVLTSQNIVTGDAGDGTFMLSFAVGFLMIAPLTWAFTDEKHWWSLIPGSIFALVGLTVMYGGVFEQTLILLGQLWPVALILGGIYVIYRVIRPGAKPT